MADKKVTYEIGVDSSKGISGIKSFSRAVQQELKNVEDEFEDTATAGEKVALALSKIAGELDTELDRAAEAAEALGRALGPDLAAKADVGSIVGDLQKMGLTFEDIVADADKLATSLKELDQVQVKGLDSGLGGVSTRVGDIDSASRGAKSALANMIGNATQDLGVLSGVAGSAGVAIGQMAEYAADARLEGQGIGSVVKSMASVAAPIAGIALATKLIGDHMADIAATEAFNKARVDSFAEALEDATLSAHELQDVLSGEEEFGIFARIDENTQDLDENVRRTLGTFDEFMRRLQDPRGVDEYAQSILDMAAAADLSKQQHLELEDAVKAAMDGEIDGSTVIKASNAGMEDQILTLVALASARKGTAEGATEAAFREEFYGDAVEETGEKTEKATEKAMSYGDAVLFVANKFVELVAENQAATAEAQAFADAVVAAAMAAADTKMQMEDLVGVFDQIGKRGDALRSIFDLQNKPLDVEGQVRDIELAIDDLSEAAKDIDLSEGLDPSNVNADALLDAIDSLRPQIQQRVVEAFSAGGPEAATQLAQDYIAQVAEELGVSEMDAAKLLGMEDVTAIVNVAIEQTSLANAQAQLDILTGLGGETPLTASIALGLQAGTLTADQAQLLVQEALRGEGVDIPAELAIKPKPGEMRKAREALQTEADDNPTKQPVEPKGLEKAAATITAGPAGGWPAIEVPVVPVFPSGYTAGGSTPSGGPLMAGPTAMGLATTGPTATASSAVPMTLALPMSAPAAARAYTVNVVLNAAVIGAPLDIMRAVDDAMRRGARLLPAGP